MISYGPTREAGVMGNVSQTQWRDCNVVWAVRVAPDGNE